MASLKIKIALTNNCLSSCSFCYLREKTKEEEIISNKNILKIGNFIQNESNKYSKIRVVLSGGDAALHPDFLDISEYYKNLVGPKVQIRADFCSTSDKEIVNKYLNLDNVGVISLNHDSIDDTFSMAKQFHDRNKSTGLSVTLSKFNMDRIEDISEAVIDYDVMVRFGSIYNENISENELNILIIALEKAGEILIKNKYKYWNFFFGFLSIDNFRPDYCGYGKNYYYFTPNGNYKRCPVEPVIGNINDKIISIEKTIPHKEECLKCEEWSFCHGGCYNSNKSYKYCKLYKKSLEIIRRLKDGHKSFRKLD